MVFPIPWYVALLVSLPESYLIFLVGFTLFNLKLGPWQLLIISILSALIGYLVRLLPIVFGVHTVIIMAGMIFITLIITRYRLISVIIATLAGFVVFGIIEIFILWVAFMISSLNPSDLIIKPYFNIVLFIPMSILCSVFYYYLVSKKISIADFSSINNIDSM